MAIIVNRNLLGCSTLRDWAAVNSELPHIMRNAPEVAPERRNMLLYFAMQGAAPFHTCTVLYRQQVLLLYGAAELRVLLDFLFRGVSIERELWRFPLPLPGDKPQLTAAELSSRERERIFSTRVPHCDFTVDTQVELDTLRAYYTSPVSAAICCPML